MIHLYIMLFIIAHILWLCAFVMAKTCADSDEAWTPFEQPFQFTNRKPNINDGILSQLKRLLRAWLIEEGLKDDNTINSKNSGSISCTN